MFKYIVPILFFGLAAYVWHYNQTNVGSSYMLFPLLDRIPSLESDMPAQAEWSWRIMAGLGVFMLLIAIWSDFRGRGKKSVEDEGGE